MSSKTVVQCHCERNVVGQLECDQRLNDLCHSTPVTVSRCLPANTRTTDVEQRCCTHSPGWCCSTPAQCSRMSNQSIASHGGTRMMRWHARKLHPHLCEEHADQEGRHGRKAAFASHGLIVRRLTERRWLLRPLRRCSSVSQQQWVIAGALSRHGAHLHSGASLFILHRVSSWPCGGGPSRCHGVRSELLVCDRSRLAGERTENWVTELRGAVSPTAPGNSLQHLCALLACTAPERFIVAAGCNGKERRV